MRAIMLFVFLLNIFSVAFNVTLMLTPPYSLGLMIINGASAVLSVVTSIWFYRMVVRWVV